jgi:enoyl-CoA hydratase/carnithine racemase
VVKLNDRGGPVGYLAATEKFSTIEFDVRDDGIAILKLNRPSKLNAFDEQMMSEIRQVVWRANFDDTIKVILITGNGRAFCSGRDIPSLQWENNLPTQQFRAYVRASHMMFDEIEHLEKPVVCVINGVCAGGGVELAISSDFRIMSTEATMLLTENNLGVLPASGACSRMIQMIGLGRLKDMVMLARPFGAEECRDIGLAHEVHSRETLLDNAIAFGKRLCERSALAMGMAKHVLNTCQNVDTETGRILERLGQSVLIKTQDAQEGIAAFKEKRKPRFKSR